MPYAMNIEVNMPEWGDISHLQDMQGQFAAWVPNRIQLRPNHSLDQPHISMYIEWQVLQACLVKVIIILVDKYTGELKVKFNAN